MAFRGGQRTAVEHRPQRLTVQQFRHHVVDAVLGADVVYREDVRVIEGGSGARLLREALQPVGIARGSDGPHLDRDIALEASVTAAIDLAHAARTDERLDPDVPDGRADEAQEDLLELMGKGSMGPAGPRGAMNVAPTSKHQRSRL